MRTRFVGLASYAARFIAAQFGVAVRVLTVFALTSLTFKF